MKKLYLITVLYACIFTVTAQTNYLDNYIGNPVTPTIIGSSANQVDLPSDLDFKPHTNELWVCNKGTTANGGSLVIFYNAGKTNQTSQYRKDTHTSHFMVYPSAMAYGDDGKWAAVSEIQNTNSASPTFMGPALWTGDTNITAKVFQNNWAPGYPLGSHLDMLHQSPFSMGIAHDSAMIYWVLDGHNGNICKYDFVADHGPGYDDHSAGKIWRYTDVPVTRVPNIPSHMVLDKASGWLYFIDAVSKKVKRMNTTSGSITGTLTTPPTAQEPLAGYWKVEGAIVEELDTLATQPCGIDYYDGRLIVSDFTTGDIYLYSTDSAFTQLATISTGLPGIMGIKVGPDGQIWCVNQTQNNVYRLDVTPPVKDVAVLNITSPAVENHLSNFFATNFNICNGTVTPEITLANYGTDTVFSVEIEYMTDGGTPIPFTWSGTLLTGNTAVVTLPSSAVTDGSHLLSIQIGNVNGTADEVSLNNRSDGAFRSIAAPVSLPFNEGFSAISFPPSGWNYVHFNPNNEMSRVTTGGFGLSTGSLKMDNYSGQMDITDQKDYFLSPLINMNSASVNTWLRFNVAYAKYNASSNDALQVSISTDCGNSWTSVYNKSGTNLATAPNSTGAWTPTSTQWRTDSVNLGFYAGLPEVLISFTGTSNFGNNLYIDDIFIGDYTTGITEAEAENQIKIFPNPAADIITIDLLSGSADHANGFIYSPTGQVVKTFSFSGTAASIQLDISELAAGIYAIQIKNNKGIYTRNLLKQ